MGSRNRHFIVRMVRSWGLLLLMFSFIPFKLISLPAFGEHDEGDLMFEVWGRIEVLAPR